ncbi:MAG TPA: hypothetical protein VKV79_08395 [Terriglobia bacterium]|nr:hypothetical protein [Terriglobia bacterium]
MSENGSNLIRLCGLWLTHGDKGDYLGGRLGGAKVFVFKNRQKASEKSPDYWVCLAPLPKDDRPKASDPANPHGVEVTDDDVPF